MYVTSIIMSLFLAQWDDYHLALSFFLLIQLSQSSNTFSEPLQASNYNHDEDVVMKNMRYGFEGVNLEEK